MAGREPGRGRRGIPTARNVDHVGLTVPDLEQAIAFFVDVLGADLLFRAGPFADPDGDAMATTLGVDPRASATVALLRCGPVTNVELLEFRAPDRAAAPPRNSDPGAAHLAFYVDDLDAAVAYLRGQPGVEVMGGPTVVVGQPSAGLRYVYVRSPWGLQLELASYPDGLVYERTTAARHYGPAPAWTTGGGATDGGDG